jgi:hypothetical protein
MTAQAYNYNISNTVFADGAYSYGSYSGSWDIFDSILSSFGVPNASSAQTISPSVLSAIQTGFILSQNLPTPIADVNNGRISPIDIVTLVTAEGSTNGNVGKSFSTGNADQLLGQWTQILQYINYQVSGKYSVATNIPVTVQFPGGAQLEFSSAQLLYDYLVRSDASLFSGDINQTITQRFNDILGRPPSLDDLAAWSNVLYTTGTDAVLLSQLSHSAEAAAAISSVYQAVLNRPVDTGSLAGIQTQMASNTQTLSGLRAVASYSIEAASKIGTYYQNILNRSVDAPSLAGIQARLATTSDTLQAK